MDQKLIVKIASAIFCIFFLSQTKTMSAETGRGSDCTDIPGVARLFERREVHVIWVGELHGTNEMPALFGDLVCAASLTHRPIIVGLERNDDEQPLWDAYLQSDDREEARKALLQGTDWTGTRPGIAGQLHSDGRNSTAMLLLAERLWAYKQDGRIDSVQAIRLGVIPMVPAGSTLDDVANQGMANHVMEIVAAHPDALVMVLSAGGHARKNARPGLNFKPAGSLLPPSQILAVRLVGGSGEAWTCQGMACGVHQEPDGVIRRRALVLADDLAEDKGLLSAGGFDALVYTGVPTTPSLPAVPRS